MDEADISLKFGCPTCGAGPQEVCELNSGSPRFASHDERWDIAKEYRPKAKANPNLSLAARKTLAARKVRAKRS
jgi:hypothetical protein